MSVAELSFYLASSDFFHFPERNSASATIFNFAFVTIASCRSVESPNYKFCFIKIKGRGADPKAVLVALVFS